MTVPSGSSRGPVKVPVNRVTKQVQSCVSARMSARSESDPVRKLQLNARGSRSVKSRTGGMFAVIRGAAEIDADCRDLWELIQSDFHELQALVVNTLHRSGALRPGLTAHHGTDILWTLNHPDVWILLVEKRGWSPASYETWLAEASCSQLLGTTSSGQHP